jgi:hypothetical protein
MLQLNLPAYEYKLKQSADNHLIFDFIRRKYVILTPEEWVRQHFINYLVVHLHYPKSLVAVERGTVYNQLAKRTDVCIYATNGFPLMLVECKAAAVAITAATVKQASTYNKKLKAKFVVVTNGLEHYCWEVDFINHKYLPLVQVPDYQSLTDGA